MNELAELKALLKEKGIEHYCIGFTSDTLLGHEYTLTIFDSGGYFRDAVLVEYGPFRHVISQLEKYFIEKQTLTPQF